MMRQPSPLRARVIIAAFADFLHHDVATLITALLFATAASARGRHYSDMLMLIRREFTPSAFRH